MTVAQPSKPWVMTLNAAIRTAHGEAQCGDYYCGCWDNEFSDQGHTERFVRALNDQGYEIVPTDTWQALLRGVRLPWPRG